MGGVSRALNAVFAVDPPIHAVGLMFRALSARAKRAAVLLQGDRYTS